MILTSYSVMILQFLDSFETYGDQNYNGNYIEADSLWRMLSCIRSYMKELMIYDESDPIEIAVKEKLKEGQVFKTFSELCRQCEIPLNEGGKQRDLAKSVLSRYVDFSEFVPEGRKRTNYRINEIYAVPHLQFGRGGRYRSRLIPIICYYIMNRESSSLSNRIILTFDELAEEVGLIKPAFMELISVRNGITDHLDKLPESVKELNPRHISDFIASCRSRFNEYLRRALDDMTNRGLIKNFDEKYWLRMLDGSQRWAEDWEQETISRLYNEIVTSARPLHLMKNSERRAVLDNLLKEINAECEQYYENSDNHEKSLDTEIQGFYKRIIIYNVDEIKAAADRNDVPLLDFEQSELLKDELSALFSETMKRAFVSQYNGLIHSEQIKNEELNKSLAFGERSYESFYAFIYEDYVEDMERLIDLTIDREMIF